MQDGGIRRYTASGTFGHSILWNTYSNRILTLFQPRPNLLLLVSKGGGATERGPLLVGLKAMSCAFTDEWEGVLRGSCVEYGTIGGLIQCRGTAHS